VTLDHVVLEVRDPARSVQFYGEVLGLAPVRFDEFLAGSAPFPSVRISRATVLDLFPQRLWRGAEPRNPNHLCLTLERAACAAVRRRLRSKRIAITLRDDHNFGARGWGRSIYFDDPDGISVEVRYYP
jgi:catechol 2,3-dioxygenase-like lactoylglutathione lyase family enzyme